MAAWADSDANPANDAILPDESFDLNRFATNDFEVAGMIENLTQALIQQQQTGSEAFDPTPFISVFESVLQDLIPLRKGAMEQVARLELDVTAKERLYRNKVDEIYRGFEMVTNQFSNLDVNIGQVGKTAIRIGEQLESIDRMRARASEAHDIILYYNEFARGDTTRLEALRKSGKDGRAKVAVVARRLLAVARDVEAGEQANQTRATIEKYAERFEKDMLRLFERAYLKGEPKVMAHCAQTLLDFNGGHSCVQIYVNQHDFFISRDRLESHSNATTVELWEILPDPNQAAPRVEPQLARLYDDIRAQISQEAQIIDAVFPQPAYVMQVFLQRVFAQVVQSHVEDILATAQANSNLAYLRMLALCRASTAQLVEDLKAHSFFRSVGKGPLASADDGPKLQISHKTEPSTGHTGVAAVAVILDQQLDELFEQHIESGRYLDREAKCLTELYASYLLKFANWHRSVNQVKPSNTIFDRVVNQLTTAAASGGATPAPAAGQSGGLKNLLKLSGIGSAGNRFSVTSGKDVSAVGELDPADGNLRLEVAEKMLKWHGEALGRMIELTSPNDVPKHAFALLQTLADSFCKAYLQTALETAISQLDAYDSRSEPDLNSVTTLRLVDSIMHIWQRYTSLVVVPLAYSSVTIRREMSIYLNHLLVRIEGKVNLVLQRSMDCIIRWLAVCLNKQKRLDYKPKNDELAFAHNNTEPCVACCDFLTVVEEVTRTALNGANADLFLTEVGVTFHSLLLDHLKNHPVSATGGLMLTKDLAMYQDTIKAFKLSSLNDRFEMLRRLGNIYVVQPSILKSYLKEAYLGRIESSLLRPFLSMRADYPDYSKRYWDDVCSVE